MKGFLRFLNAVLIVLLPAAAMAQDPYSGNGTFIDKAIWFIVPALALVVIVLMVRNRQHMANRAEDDDR